MKYIKRYNEELDPSTYRRAASSLRYYNKDKKADVLSDYADSKEFGFYKFNLGLFLTSGDGDVEVKAKDYTFSDPALIGIYYGFTNDSALTYPENIIRKEDTDDYANNLVSKWANGEESLCVTFEFGFKPTKETININNDKQPPAVDVDLLKNPSSKSRRWDIHGGRVPLFSIQLSLCGWNEGIEEWDAESKWQAEHDNYEFTPSTFHDIYEYENQARLEIVRPNIPTLRSCGIFADRQSAFKFKKLLPELIDEKAKSKIVDILRIVGASGEHLDKTLKSFDKIRLHGLYDDDCQTYRKRRWYRQIT
jgi:hypothetical protein